MKLLTTFEYHCCSRTKVRMGLGGQKGHPPAPPCVFETQKSSFQTGFKCIKFHGHLISWSEKDYISQVFNFAIQDLLKISRVLNFAILGFKNLWWVFDFGMLENQIKKNTFASINDTVFSNHHCLKTSRKHYYHHLDHAIHFRLQLILWFPPLTYIHWLKTQRSDRTRLDPFLMYQVHQMDLKMEV